MFKRIIRQLLLAPLALVLLFEEWGWSQLAALFARLARLPVWGRMEQKIAALPPYAALLVFGLLTLALLPLKLLALYLFGLGEASAGLALLVSAKVLGTAVMARLFQLTQPALMTLPWFARWYPRWKHWKDGVLAWVRQSALWRVLRQLKTQMKTWF